MLQVFVNRPLLKKTYHAFCCKDTHFLRIGKIFLPGGIIFVSLQREIDKMMMT
jgi:hypothetical protein